MELIQTVSEFSLFTWDFAVFCALMVIHPAELLILSLLNTHLSQICETVEFKRIGIYWVT